MKKVLIVTTFVLTFIFTVVLIGCSSNKSNTPQQSNQNTTSQSNTAANVPNKTFTVADLKNYTGANGGPAYVAVSGIVYDVTHARKWRNGQHEQGIVAGVDLTNAMGDSPHGTSVLSEIPIVGKLK